MRSERAPRSVLRGASNSTERLGRACRLLKKFQMQGRREEETGAYWVVREDFRRPRTQQMDFFSSLLGKIRETPSVIPHRTGRPRWTESAVGGGR